MASKHSKSFGSKNGSHKPNVIGRSAITGQLLFKPASKHSSITIKEAVTAAKAVRTEHKK
jgi:hypothetical protein